MTLQDRLVELVTARGPDLLADPGEFRAALDDYLTDDEITPGDRNVLTDAVRLGAVERLLYLLDHGSDPRAAVHEAGMALARERGSDDARRSLRATAQLGYATGRLDHDVVREFDREVPTAAPPPPPSSFEPVPPAFAPTRVIAPAGAAPAPPPARRARRTVRWVTGGVALLLLGGAAVWWFLLRDATPEDVVATPEDVVEELFATRTCEAAVDLMTGAAAESTQAEIDAGVDSAFCTTYGDYSSAYDVTSVDERGDRATVEIEGTQHYDGSDESEPNEQDFAAVIDLRRIDGEWLVSNVEWEYTGG